MPIKYFQYQEDLMAINFGLTHEKKLMAINI